MTFGTFIAAALLAWAGPARPQTDNFDKNFKKFSEVAKGIDVFASAEHEIADYRTPLGDARGRLAAMLGEPLQRGALVICTTLDQKDTVSEAKIVQRGYKWVVIQDSPQVSTQRMLAQLKASGNVPPEMLKRIESGAIQIGGGAAGAARMIAGTMERIASALVMTTLAPEKPFRASRLDDAGRSPLEDWLDIGLASYAAGNTSMRTMILQQRIDEAFPLEDVLGMSRPFVAPPAGGGMPGGGMQIRIAGPPPGGGAPASPAPAPPGGAAQGGPGGAGRPPMAMNLPKDVADRMMFDGQAVALFSYVLERRGADATRALVQWNRSGKPSREFLARPELLGPDLDKAEKDWLDWIKKQKTEMPAGMRIMTAPAGPPPKP